MMNLDEPKQSLRENGSQTAIADSCHRDDNEPNSVLVEVKVGVRTCATAAGRRSDRLMNLRPLVGSLD